MPGCLATFTIYTLFDMMPAVVQSSSYCRAKRAMYGSLSWSRATQSTECVTERVENRASCWLIEQQGNCRESRVWGTNCANKEWNQEQKSFGAAEVNIYRLRRSSEDAGRQAAGPVIRGSCGWDVKLSLLTVDNVFTHQQITPTLASSGFVIFNEII